MTPSSGLLSRLSASARIASRDVPRLAWRFLLVLQVVFTVVAAFFGFLGRQWVLAFWVMLVPSIFVFGVLVLPVAAWDALETYAPMVTQRIKRYTSIVVSSAFAISGLWLYGGHVAVFFAPTSTTAYWWRYNTEFPVDYANVTVDRRPHDCDFMTAPLGAKHCHYVADVLTVRSRAASDGTHSVSFDGGKTWRADNSTPPTSPEVYVSWRKVED